MRNVVGKTVGVAAAALIVVFAGACGSDTIGTGPPIYTASLTAANEPGSIASNGSGTATFVDNGTQIDWTLTFDGVTNMTVSHIHGPCNGCSVPPITAVPVIINLWLPVGNAGPAHRVTVTGQITNNSNQAVSLDSLRTLFNNGKSYANVHSTANPGGEIRGDIIRSN
jgi:hypothetical protein